MMMTIEIVVDEGIYDSIISRCNIEDCNERIIVKSTISPEIVKCVFLYRSADSIKILERYITDVKEQLEEQVSSILIHDSIMHTIAKGEEIKTRFANALKKEGDDIYAKGEEIKTWLEGMGFKRIRLCSQVGSSRVIKSLKPISRVEYTKYDWQECTVKEIKGGEIENDFLEVVEDRNFEHFNEIYICILTFLLGRFWNEKRETSTALFEARTERFAKFRRELDVYYDYNGFPSGFDEKTYYDAMMPLLEKRHDNERGNCMNRGDFEEKYKKISDTYNKIKWES